MNSPRPATHSDLPQIIDLLDKIFRREKVSRIKAF